VTGWRLFFWVATVFNLLAGLPLLLAPDVMMMSLDVDVPADLLFHRFTGLLVVCFGALYALVAQDAVRFRPLVWLGIVGKVGVVALFTEAYVNGLVPFSLYAISLGDVAFVAGFIAFLMTTRRRT
jgi:hypothetical protein